jgi:hypothetical protein
VRLLLARAAVACWQANRAPQEGRQMVAKAMTGNHRFFFMVRL